MEGNWKLLMAKHKTSSIVCTYMLIKYYGNFQRPMCDIYCLLLYECVWYFGVNVNIAELLIVLMRYPQIWCAGRSKRFACFRQYHLFVSASPKGLAGREGPWQQATVHQCTYFGGSDDNYTNIRGTMCLA